MEKTKELSKCLKYPISFLFSYGTKPDNQYLSEILFNLCNFPNAYNFSYSYFSSGTSNKILRTS